MRSGLPIGHRKKEKVMENFSEYIDELRSGLVEKERFIRSLVDGLDNGWSGEDIANLCDLWRYGRANIKRAAEEEERRITETMRKDLE
jgi:hypothetical protein